MPLTARTGTVEYICIFFSRRNKPRRMNTALHFFQLWKYVHVYIYCARGSMELALNKKRWLKSRENPNYCCRFSARVRSTAIKLCHFNIYHYCFKPPCIIPHVVQDVHNSTTNVLFCFFFTICQGQFPNRGKLIHAFIQGEQTSVLL